MEVTDAARPLIDLSVAALGTRRVVAALDKMDPADLPEVAVAALRSALSDHLHAQEHGPRVQPSKFRMDWSQFEVEGDRELDHQIDAVLHDPYTEGAGWNRDVTTAYVDAITECPDVSYLRLAQIVTEAFALDPDGSMLLLEGMGTPHAVLGVQAVLTEAVAVGVVQLGQQQLDWLHSEAALARGYVSNPAA